MAVHKTFRQLKSHDTVLLTSLRKRFIPDKNPIKFFFSFPRPLQLCRPLRKAASTSKPVCAAMSRFRPAVSLYEIALNPNLSRNGQEDTGYVGSTGGSWHYWPEIWNLAEGTGVNQRVDRHQQINQIILVSLRGQIVVLPRGIGSHKLLAAKRG
jgi:hypothetical protein